MCGFAFELWYGASRSQRKDANTQRLEAFLAGPLEWTLFDEEDAREAGTVRAELEISGKPIGAYDVLIAGKALRRGATLVTDRRNCALRYEQTGLPRSTTTLAALYTRSA